MSVRKRFYTAREIAEFGADGTNWQAMHRAALVNVTRCGQLDSVLLTDARRMGELAGLSNRKIGKGIARALARSRRALPSESRRCCATSGGAPR